MAQGIRVGIIGAGWPGLKHAEGYRGAGGMQVAAVADLISARRSALAKQFGATAEYADADALIADTSIAAVSICLPNHLHAATTIKALKAGKHVICETAPSINAGEARKMSAAARKARRVLMFAAQRRFGGAEQAAHQAVGKGYAGQTYHVRASWMRTRGVPAGSGNWYTDRSKSGGGALLDTGFQMLDLAWHLLGRPRPVSAYAITAGHSFVPDTSSGDVEAVGFALIRFEGSKSIELATSWAINQPPQQQGTVLRVYGEKGAVEVYTPKGPLLYRNFGPKGEAKEVILKTPKVTHYPAMMRHFRQCIQAETKPIVGPADGVVLMRVMDALYKSAATGKSVEIKAEESRLASESEGT